MIYRSFTLRQKDSEDNRLVVSESDKPNTIHIMIQDDSCVMEIDIKKEDWKELQNLTDIYGNRFRWVDEQQTEECSN